MDEQAESTSQTPRTGSSETESLLPTYEQQFQSTNAESPVSPPGPTATSNEIRDFLTRLLILKRTLAPDHAHRIASKWTLGNGRELRSYPPAMYLDIFGREDGWVVYKETKLCIAHEKGNKGRTSFWRHCLYMLVCLAALAAVSYALA